jgi:hypothetical protein
MDEVETDPIVELTGGDLRDAVVFCLESVASRSKRSMPEIA